MIDALVKAVSSLSRTICAGCFFMTLYFAALVLPEHLNAEIKQFKTFMQERWGCSVALKSPAHITLIPPFWMAADIESAFLHDLYILCKSMAPFSVATANFAAFKPRTIFIQPVLHEPLHALKHAVDAFCKTHPQYGAKADTRPFHPHITIATRDLHKRAFAEAWPYFETKKYEVQFEVTGLGVLRHNTRHWDVVHTAPFSTA
jgi:2'-5' RNA ligase